MQYALALTRVSDESQSDNSSIESQLVGIKNVLASKNIDLVHTISETASGGANRDSVNEAYEFIKNWNRSKKSKKITYLVVYAWSRYFRDVALSGYWLQMFREIGVEVNSASRWIDYSTRAGIFEYAIEIAQAASERKSISEHTLRGMWMRTKQGNLVTKAPRGVVKIKVDNDLYIDKCPKYGDAYTSLFSLLSQGVKVKEAYVKLGGANIFGSMSALYEAIRNEVYCGRKHFEGKLQGYEDLYVSLNAISTVTDYNTWLLANENVKVDERKSKYKENDYLFVAKDIIRCPITYEVLGTTIPKGRSRSYYYYRCRCGNHDKKAWRVSKEAVDDLLERVIADLQIAPAAYEYFKQKSKTLIDQSSSLVKQNIAKLKTSLEEAKTRSQKALEMRVDGEITKEEYKAIKAKQLSIEASILEANMVMSVQGETYTKVFTMFADIKNLWVNVDSTAKKAMLQMIFPEGFVVGSKSPNDVIPYCRTATINDLFSLSGFESESYGAIKIETGINQRFIPVKGG